MSSSRMTLAGPARCSGIGLFSGQDAALSILPAPAGSGLRFRVAQHEIPATIEQLTSHPIHPAFAGARPRNTSLSVDPSDAESQRVLTTEHVLGALVGLGVTDVIIELEGPEIPIGDGSANEFVEILSSAGLVALEGESAAIVPTEPIRVGDDSSWIELHPIGHDQPPSYTYQIDYGTAAPFLAHSANWDGSTSAFCSDIAPARTFSLDREVSPLRTMGLFTRFSTEDLLVLDETGPINNQWRHELEPARHKVLDMIGDLVLAGGFVHARIVACRSGHSLNHELARAIRAMA